MSTQTAPCAAAWLAARWVKDTNEAGRRRGRQRRQAPGQAILSRVAPGASAPEPVQDHLLLLIAKVRADLLDWRVELLLAGRQHERQAARHLDARSKDEDLLGGTPL